MFLRNIITVIFLLLFSSLMGQTPETGDCEIPSDSAIVDINNVSMRLNGSNSIWWNFIFPRYEVPKDSDTHSIYAGGIWVGGLDQDQELRFFGHIFGQSAFSGPLIQNNGQTSDSFCEEYDRFWVVYRYEVEEFIESYQDPSYQIPEVIQNWPAHGNVAEGYAEYLAPFYDNNGDGVYNPEDGDYPAFNISGELDCEESLKGDVCVYWIMNDTGNETDTTGSLPLGIEVHGMAYAYESPIDAINNATFYEYRVINRSLNDYHDVYFSQWADGEIGCGFDDYVGCDVERNMGYTYNGEYIDSDCGQQNGYGSHPPAVGLKFLDAPWRMNETDGQHIQMSYFSYFINQSFGNPTSDPEIPYQYYNYMQGMWKDSTDLLYGGTGHQNSSGSSTISSRYAFPWDSDQENYWGTNGVEVDPWTEESAGNPPGDRRMVLTNGPFDLASGEEFSVTLAVPWARDLYNPDPKAAIYRLQEAADILQEFHDNCYGEELTSVVEHESKKITCYPNPFSTQAYFKIEGHHGDYTLRVYDLYGKLVREQQGRQTGEIIFDRKGLAQGTYIYSIQVGDVARQTGKMVVMD